VPFTPTFHQGLELQALSALDLTAIVGELNDISHSLDSIPRLTAIWRSLTSAPLFTTVGDWKVEYTIDSTDEKLVVLSVRR